MFNMGSHTGFKGQKESARTRKLVVNNFNNEFKEYSRELDSSSHSIGLELARCKIGFLQT